MDNSKSQPRKREIVSTIDAGYTGTAALLLSTEGEDIRVVMPNPDSAMLFAAYALDSKTVDWQNIRVEQASGEDADYLSCDTLINSVNWAAIFPGESF